MREILKDQLAACSKCAAYLEDNVATILDDSGVMTDQQVVYTIVFLHELHKGEHA